MTDETVTEAECARIRQSYSFKGGFSPLMEEFGLDRPTLQTHLYGDCDHDAGVDPVVPPSRQQVTAAECRSMRERIQEGATVPELVEETDRYRDTVTRHVTGECSHSVSAPTIDEEDTYTRDMLAADRCLELRERFHASDADNVLSFADRVEESYEVVLRHLNGHCTHEVSAPPREVVERGTDTTARECRDMRDAWRDDPDMTFEELADRFDKAPETVEKHIKFHCSHDGEDLLVDEMSVFEPYFEDA